MQKYFYFKNFTVMVEFYKGGEFDFDASDCYYIIFYFRKGNKRWEYYIYKIYNNKNQGKNDFKKINKKNFIEILKEKWSNEKDFYNYFSENMKIDFNNL